MSPPAKVSGTIAIRSVDGRYLKVLWNDGLAFGSQKLDDKAKFEVKQFPGGKIGLVGERSDNFQNLFADICSTWFSPFFLPSPGPNEKHVNMYYVNDVMCKGPSGGVSLGIVHLEDGLVNFTISGYSGMNGCTKFLSCFAGSEAYEGSIAVVAKIGRAHV